ncbi:MAG: hypothetical protein WC319_01015 [Candidatus Paceibacterota bacterium]
MTLMIVLMSIILIVAGGAVQLFKKSLDVVGHWIMILGVLLFIIGTEFINTI